MSWLDSAFSASHVSQDSYTAAQQGWKWSVADFIGEVRKRQA